MTYIVLSVSTFAQIVETEPNNICGDSGVITIISNNTFYGTLDGVSFGTDYHDVWKINAGYAGLITISNPNNFVRITLITSSTLCGSSNGSDVIILPGTIVIIALSSTDFYRLDVITTDNFAIQAVYSFTITGEPALPVELTSFTASLINNNVMLKWETITEVNNHGFNVERKPENGDWGLVGFVAGAGNSNSPKNYSFTDLPTGGTSFSYRLKQIDNDGKSKFYDAITITLDLPITAELMDNYPNPFNPSTAIKFYIPNSSYVLIKIYDMLGREVTMLVNKQTEAGYHIVYWNGLDRFGNSAASGVYLYRLTAGSFSETKKMLMMK